MNPRTAHFSLSQWRSPGADFSIIAQISKTATCPCNSSTADSPTFSRGSCSSRLEALQRPWILHCRDIPQRLSQISLADQSPHHLSTLRLGQLRNGKDCTRTEGGPHRPRHVRGQVGANIG